MTQPLSKIIAAFAARRVCAGLCGIAFVASTAWAQDVEIGTLAPDDPDIRSGLVQVAVLDNDGEVRRIGSGFIVGDAGHVLTAAHLVAGEERIELLPLTSPGVVFEGRVVHANDRADLALLAVAGLPVEGLPLALDGFAPGRVVYSSGIWQDSGESEPLDAADSDRPASLTLGAVGEAVEIPALAGAPAVPLLSHNAMIPAAGYGGPLLNECGEVAGVNRGAPGVSAARLRRGEAPEDAVYAAGVTALVGLMNEVGIPVSRVAESCVSVRDAALAQAAAAAERAEQAESQAQQAESEAQEAQSRAEEAEALAARAQSESTEAGERLEQAQQELAETASRAEEAEILVDELEARYEEAVRSGAAEADTLRAELDAAIRERDNVRAETTALQARLTSLQAQMEERREADAVRLYAVAGAAAAVILLLLIVFLVVSRKRSRELALATGAAAEARMEAEQAREAAEVVRSAQAREALAPDCVLNGKTADGRTVSLKIPGSMLAGDGSVIGRNPRNSTFLIDDDTLSREHARLFAEDDRLLIENLGATNGVVVNGRELAAHAATRLRDGDRIELGGVELQFGLRLDAGGE